ncbi:hypothetical protein WJ0W_001418 [Paenibacillus melissococcoides]|uniref:Uncharacterized protein n=1 Tax=Paenibacillus melissococcoides TaxID=2912268 RepID=A0ABN8TZH5_9BACL|nr:MULTISPECIES: hypothetical protein [Paenibacillus]MEB9893674.1 hypothetical protein [Bacillus cereus]CAH8244180.1 hypothetical protein WJ0W_001418 [Paenibacillus melissococcoides]CAH8703709.1 hypothetical protein HTL2_000245 [Paenibacillus melissococcoides]CAH8706218.1 hypothetical protein WDD9_001207 [Paenibacillus melissococcoides]
MNVGENKNEDCGYALQNAWKNGNKNDFIVSFIAEIMIWVLAGVTLVGQYIYKNERRERRHQKLLESLNQRTIQIGDKSVKIRILK